MESLAIYTVLTGGKEPLGNPILKLESKETDLRIHFICLTDNRELSSDIWECRYFDTHTLPSEKSSRRPKALPHQYLSDFRYSLYIDNICELKRLPKSDDLRAPRGSEYVYRLFKHSTRSQISDECLAIASLGYDKPETLLEQLDTYANHISLDKITPLGTCTVLLREHNHKKIIEHGTIWWEHILNFSQRDQMSFDFCRIYSHLKVDYFNGTKFSNDLIHDHNNANRGRRLANINGKSYTRALKRICHMQGKEVPDAHDIQLAEEFAKTNESALEILFYLTNSSLGNFHYPRLRLTDSIMSYLSGYRNTAATLITLFLKSAEKFGISENEYIKANVSIQAYLSPSKSVSLNEIGNCVPTIHSGLNNDDIVVFIVFNAQSESRGVLHSLSEQLLNYSSRSLMLAINFRNKLPFVERIEPASI
jgi:hypothetical protein